MYKYKLVSRCKKCGKIYPNGIPRVCYKCGAEIGTKVGLPCLDDNNLRLTSNCEKVVARRKIFKWEIKE